MRFQTVAGENLSLVFQDKRPRQVVGSQAFEQPERTRKGLIDKLTLWLTFKFMNTRVSVF